MKKIETIYTDHDHKWSVIARDPAKPNYLIDTNEYLIESMGLGLLTDPGGSEIFPEVFSALGEVFAPSNLKNIFASHQDPDIISSIALWLEVNPEIKCYISWLWTSFLPHFGGNAETFIPLNDEGADINHGSLKLRAIPAHYLHSAGNLHLWDEKAKILFSGDIGAALLPLDETALFVKDFDKHIRYMEKFHSRWMASEQAKLLWCERIMKLKPDMLCPQHGAIFQGKDVERFINWFHDLKIGMDALDLSKS
ncbi:MBL fold metallo-hydrolase [Leptospira ognonensis]|uniref:MBL fold metallo-hydrolase n=1 Tax=Leptospira ognonensis TaxID=2484945 RepID=A0A4R9K1I0_9LEPT|nr:MBL fold metallo-hydrolase [Leptospira ognonensis]TGL58036.1 MBL fold metallo-hydrolase [Leptospira ognonensis]